MPITAVLGAHWGDEGKGKIVAALSQDACVTARFQGGPNAGHSVVLAEGKSPWVLRMVPSGILTGAVGVIGGGCVIEPTMLMAEVTALRQAFPDILGRLIVSRRAHVITSEHRAADRGGSGVGSTRMGVGPAYRDKAARSGLRVADLLGAGDLPASLREVGIQFTELLGRCCGDDRAYVRDVLDRGGRIVAEGAQGTRLDIDHGDYPYVTSSNTTIGAVLTGLGVGPGDIADVLLVTPAYVTKVGGGFMPSRVSGSLNSLLQTRGQELDGATNLMRDTGWLDLGWLRHACRLNQATGLILTKVDVLADLSEVGCYDDNADPVLRMMPGWGMLEARTGAGAGALGDFLSEIEAECATPVRAVSYGPGVSDWWRRDPGAAPGNTRQPAEPIR